LEATLALIEQSEKPQDSPWLAARFIKNNRRISNLRRAAAAWLADSREILYPKPLFIGFLRQSGAGRNIAVTATAWFPAARTQRQ
jgi:hypothetical protein